MIKNYVILLGTIIFSNKVGAQTGNVGINTQTPTKTLDINGDVRVRSLPEMPLGSSIVADAQGNLGISKLIGNENTLYFTSNNVRQNQDVIVPRSSILNVLQTNAQDSGGSTIQEQNCWTIPNSEVYFKFPSAGSARKGNVSWNIWFEIKGIQNSSAFPLIPSIMGDSNSTKVTGPIWWHNRLYAVYYIKVGTIWNKVNTVSVNMSTTYLRPDFQEAVKYDTSGNLYTNPGDSNSNYRYFISAFFNVGEDTNINVLPDSEYKVELKFGIENLSTQNLTLFDTNGQFFNWGVQANAYSFVKM